MAIFCIMQRQRVMMKNTLSVLVSVFCLTELFFGDKINKNMGKKGEATRRNIQK